VTPRLRSLAGLALGLLLAYFGGSLPLQCARRPAWDFAVNWTAAQGLRRGLSLYDPAGLLAWLGAGLRLLAASSAR
jgi:hypothetical protein